MRHLSCMDLPQLLLHSCTIKSNESSSLSLSSIMHDRDTKTMIHSHVHAPMTYNQAQVRIMHKTSNKKFH